MCGMGFSQLKWFQSFGVWWWLYLESPHFAAAVNPHGANPLGLAPFSNSFHHYQFVLLSRYSKLPFPILLSTNYINNKPQNVNTFVLSTKKYKTSLKFCIFCIKGQRFTFYRYFCQFCTILPILKIWPQFREIRHSCCSNRRCQNWSQVQLLKKLDKDIWDFQPHTRLCKVWFVISAQIPFAHLEAGKIVGNSLVATMLADEKKKKLQSWSGTKLGVGGTQQSSNFSQVVDILLLSLSSH